MPAVEVIFTIPCIWMGGQEGSADQANAKPSNGGISLMGKVLILEE